MNLDIKDFCNALLNYNRALYVHQNEERSSEKLKSKDLVAMHDIAPKIKEYHAEQQKYPTPTPATLPVLHTECYDQSIPNAPARDLMTFDENQPGNNDNKDVHPQQDFLSGV